jgi:hypothetical protein
MNAGLFLRRLIVEFKWMVSPKLELYQCSFFAQKTQDAN